MDYAPQIDSNPPDDPFELFDRWYEEAREGVKYVGAACLSTVDGDGRPDARMVIAHRADGGFIVCTDERSVKARQLRGVPHAALTFYWSPDDRSVRVRGAMEPASDEAADRIFAGRPRRSRLTPWASRQSRELASREDLVARYEATEERFAGREEIPRPETWRAYLLDVREMELWQASSGRLHHRLLYRRGDDGEWIRSRLEP